MRSSLGSLLVYGAAGAQGSAIVRAGVAAGATVRVFLRPGTRNPFVTAVEIVRGDLGDPARLLLASRAAETVVLTLPQIADHARLAKFGRDAIDAAKAARVKLLILNTSGPVPATPTGAAFADAMMETEAYLRASGIPAVVVRPTLYMDNLAATWSARAIVHRGVVAYPLPADVPVSWIGMDDVARCIVAVARRPALAGRTFDLGGPEMLTGHDLAARVSATAGRPIGYAPMPLAIFAEGLNASLGGRIGDETAAFYAWVVERGAASLAFDGGSALDMLAITPTLFSEWARRQDWAALAAIAEDHEERAPRSLPDASMLHHAHAAPSAGGWR